MEEDRGLRLRDQEWFDTEKWDREHLDEEYEEKKEDEPHREEEAGEQEHNDNGKPVSEKIGRWAERKMNHAVGSAARVVLHFVTHTDWDDTAQVEEDDTNDHTESEQDAHDREVREFWENGGPDQEDEDHYWDLA